MNVLTGSLLVKCGAPLSTVWSYCWETDSAQPGDPSHPGYWSHSRQNARRYSFPDFAEDPEGDEVLWI